MVQHGLRPVTDSRIRPARRVAVTSGRMAAFSIKRSASKGSQLTRLLRKAGILKPAPVVLTSDVPVEHAIVSSGRVLAHRSASQAAIGRIRTRRWGDRSLASSLYDADWYEQFWRSAEADDAQPTGTQRRHSGLERRCDTQDPADRRHASLNCSSCRPTALPREFGLPADCAWQWQRVPPARRDSTDRSRRSFCQSTFESSERGDV